MACYEPPFEITNKMVTLISEISQKLGHINTVGAFEHRNNLRKNNRIRSINSTLAIEENSLTFEQTRAILQGKEISASQTEIRQVKNASAAYDESGKIDPYSIDELKRLHGIMTKNTSVESGSYRIKDEGVITDGRGAFMAPPPSKVPSLMSELFDWMSANRDTVHPLILSSVFHYEFVFIHPFAEGNGCMARLWQNALLTKWNSAFHYLPLEKAIQEFKDEYYSALDVSSSAGISTAFIEFMLEKIDETLKWAQQQLKDDTAGLTIYEQRLLDAMEYDVPYTALQLMEKLNIKSKETFRKHYIGTLISENLVEMSLPDKPTSRNQTYRKV